ncbi:hypothetical protein RHGRI_012604 [Rhododendron griersonianum]|uniref:Acyl-CoA dehydrogenase/oxidase C-terminal domain-containing protein n=1 Tax=Rhododendron griersonianum TaxID=479676 RepID=A0AAV6KRT5_9ERIC|nr:hypothetical protein RHGRI_012604 [Rhododendron griersonianum]
MISRMAFHHQNSTILVRVRVGSNSVAVSKSIIFSFPLQYRDRSCYIHPAAASTASSNHFLGILLFLPFKHYTTQLCKCMLFFLMRFDSAARAKELLFGGRNESPINKSWDCFLGAGLSNLEYGYLCEIMGHSVWATQMFNCGAPDTGNMEVLLRYGNKEQLQVWLIPLLEGKIRSGFAMTEPQVASSDATNRECSIERLHHCLRLIGAAERGMQMMVQRALKRRTLGKLIAKHGSFLSDFAKCGIDLEQARLLVLEAADQPDRLGNKESHGILAMAKVAAPNLALKVLDMAMQVHGAAGLSLDTILAHLWATADYDP